MCNNNCNNCNDCQPTVCGCPNGTISCKCVIYEGETLPNTGIVAGDNVCTSNKKIDDAIGEIIQSNEESELPPYNTSVVESSDTSLEVDATFDGGTLETTFDVKLGFTSTTYQEDLTITTPVVVDVVKHTSNPGSYKLDVKHKPSGLTQTIHAFTLGGASVLSGTPSTTLFIINHEGVFGTNTVIPNRISKTGVNVTLNSNFILSHESSDAGLEFSLPDATGVSATNSYIILGSIPPPCIPSRTITFSCQYTLNSTSTGAGAVLITDPRHTHTGGGSGTYSKNMLSGLIKIVPIGASYAEVRFFNLEPFAVPINVTGTTQSITIYSTSSLNYNILT